MKELRIVIIIGLLWIVGVLFLIGTYSYYQASCYEQHMSGAVLTVKGVWCFQNLGEGRSDFFYKLSDLIEQSQGTPAPTPINPRQEQGG